MWISVELSHLLGVAYHGPGVHALFAWGKEGFLSPGRESQTLRGIPDPGESDWCALSCRMERTGIRPLKGIINREISQPPAAIRNVSSQGEIPVSRVHEGSPRWPKL